MPAHQLYLLPLGALVDRNPAKGQLPRSQVPGYLIRTARGRNILIDTGNPTSLLGKETAQPWSRLGVELTPEDDIVQRLAKMGLRPKDIDLLVCTHFDFDHCGRNEVLAEANVEAVVQARHLEHARAHPTRYDPALWDFPGWEYQTVSGDTEIERGIVLIETSGHAIGHQSVYVETASGPVILAIDAIAQAWLAQTRELPDWYDDTAEALQSIDKLMQAALDYRAYLIYGHEWAQWTTLPHSPRAFTR